MLVRLTRRAARRLGAVLALLLCAGAAGGCDDEPKKNPFDPPPDAPKPAPRASAAPKPEGLPDLAIDALSPKVGFVRALIDKEGRQALTSELAEHKRFIEGLDVPLRVDRHAKQAWVSAFIDELGKLGAKHVLLTTETRQEFPSTLPFTPELTLHAPASCSLVAMLLEDRSTAVWRIGGGVASKRSKGMAGADLSMTGETIERLAKTCTAGSFFFVSAPAAVEWGELYDLAASSKTLSGLHFEGWVLLGEPPVPGHRVELRH